MGNQTDDIAEDIRRAIDKLEAKRAGKSVEIGFLIERGDLDEIEKALDD